MKKLFALTITVILTVIITLFLALPVFATEAVTGADTTAITEAVTESTTVADTTSETNAETENESEPKTNFGFFPESLATTLPLMGMGMLGIFLVTLTIILTVLILRWLGDKMDKKDAN